MAMKGFPLVLFCLLLPGPICSAADGKAEPLLARIKAVRKEGAGNPAAAKAWRELVQLGPAALFDVLAGARDRDQVDAIARELKGLGVAVDLQKQFNFIGRWLLLGPFDNTNMAGFDKPYPPEQGIDVQAGHAGKNGKIRWIEHATADP